MGRWGTEGIEIEGQSGGMDADRGTRESGMDQADGGMGSEQ